MTHAGTNSTAACMMRSSSSGGSTATRRMTRHRRLACILFAGGDPPTAAFFYSRDRYRVPAPTASSLRHHTRNRDMMAITKCSISPSSPRGLLHTPRQ